MTSVHSIIGGRHTLHLCDESELHLCDQDGCDESKLHLCDDEDKLHLCDGEVNCTSVTAK